MLENKYQAINLADPRQDVHRERIHNSNLSRYRVAEKLLPPSSKSLKVLELGGGIGEFSRRMTKRGIEVTFVDLSENNIKNARATGLEAHQIDLNLGLREFASAKFDGVVMLEVIEHIVSSEFLLEETFRVLKLGGFLILSTPNFAYITNRWRILMGNLSYDEGYHYRFFTPSILKQHLHEAGFKIEETAHTMPAMGYNVIFNRILGKPRLHIHVPDIFSSFFAHTLFIKAYKD